MKFLVDTNILSELRRGYRANQGVQEWAQIGNEDDFATSVICMMEIERGALGVRRTDPAFCSLLLVWLGEVRNQYSSRILRVDEAVASRCAALLQPRTAQLGDALIAATALVHDLTVVTRNVRDFEPLGVPLLNPWSD